MTITRKQLQKLKKQGIIDPELPKEVVDQLVELLTTEDVDNLLALSEKLEDECEDVGPVVLAKVPRANVK